MENNDNICKKCGNISSMFIENMETHEMTPCYLCKDCMFYANLNPTDTQISFDKIMTDSEYAEYLRKTEDEIIKKMKNYDVKEINTEDFKHPFKKILCDHLFQFHEDARNELLDDLLDCLKRKE